MDNPTQCFTSRIFYPTDFSLDSEMAFLHALKLALKNRARLDIFHVEDFDEHVSLLEYPQVRKALERWKILPQGSTYEDLDDLGLTVRKIRATDDNPINCILNYLNREPANLIVLATHQHKGFDRWLHKKIAEPISRKSEILTLFVPYKTPGFVNLEDGSLQLHNVVLPVDVKPSPSFVIETANSFVQALGGSQVNMHVLYVGEEFDRPALKMNDCDQCKWHLHIKKGGVASTIIETAKEYQADLIVMGTQGHNGFLDALRGSTTERVVREATCPVLAVPVYF